MPIEAVFFDLGDTIVDLREGQADYQDRLSARMGKIYDLLQAAEHAAAGTSGLLSGPRRIQ